ncbi:MAG: SH3 domain-containing protein [Caldilineaceae bacterium]
MSFFRQTQQKPRPAAGDQPAGKRYGRRWMGLAFLLIALTAGVWWAWPRLIRAEEPATQSTTPATVKTANTSENEPTTVAAPQSVVQPQVMTEKAPVQEPTLAVAAAITTTQSTSRMVVIAGTEGAILSTTPGGEQIQSLAVGVLLNATGRNAESTWLYVTSAEGVTGWVAVEQIVAFGIEKLPVVTVTAPSPADTVTDEQAMPTASGPITATAALSATTAVTLTTAATATNRTTATDTATADDTGAATGVTATVTVSGARLNIRSGPGIRYRIIGKANRNEEVTVLARNGAADWVQIALPESEDGFGWVAATYLRLSSAVADLPVSTAVSAAPTVAVAATTAPSTTSSISATQPASTQSAVVSSTSSTSGLSGTLVFQSSPGGMIYAYNLSTGRLWRLTYGFDPAISPDGQTVTYVRTAGENGIYLINIDGSNERRIFSGRSTLAAPKWSPDGNYIVFTRGDEYKECRNLGRGQCLTDEELLAQNPNFPVEDFPLTKDYESNLARVDRNGGNYRDIANLESARAADWNEAGIVYQSTAGLQITADTPDATSRLLIHDPFKPAYEDPDWQPNGGKIVFVSRGGNHREIFAVNADGSGMAALTMPVTTLVDELPNNVAPAWSSDGQHLVFLSNRGEDNSAGAWRLWVMDADGSNQHPLPINVTINYTYGNEQLVSWGR